MPSRDDVIDSVALYLHERYERSLKIQKEIERLNNANQIESVQAILATPTYRNDSRSRFSFKDLEAEFKDRYTRSSLYYALITVNLAYFKKREQVPALLEKGVAIQYYPHSKVATNALFFYDPGVLYQAAMAHFAPPEVVIQPYQPPAINRDIVEVKYEAAVTPTRIDPEHECPCPPGADPIDHERVQKMREFAEEFFIDKHNVFKGKTWNECISIVLNTFANNMLKAQKQSEEN